MKKALKMLLLLCLFLTGCGNEKKNETVSGETAVMTEKDKANTTVEEESSGENNLCDENLESEAKIVGVDYSELFQELNGCAVVYDFDANKYLVYNQDSAKERYSPFSTFKIVSTLIGLRNGVLTDENSKMDYDGTTYPIDAWNHNLTLDEAFKTSCIWYFRQIIDSVKVNEVQKELDDLQYGNCDVSEWNGSKINPMDSLNGFWLGSSLKISPMEQVEVMKKIFGGDSIYTDKEINILKAIMSCDKVNGYSIYGKTGTNGNEEGWYVGFMEKKKNKLCFAVHITSEKATCVATGNEAREIVKSIVTKLQ